MEENSKLEFLSELDEYIKSVENRMDSYLSDLDWSKEWVQEKFTDKDFEHGAMVSCRFNPNHRMPQTALSKHEEMCSWTNDGYNKEEITKLPPSSNFFYEQCSTVTSIVIDEKLQNDIFRKMYLEESNDRSSGWAYPSICFKKVPRIVNREITDLSSNERIAIYDYVVAQGRRDNKALLEGLEFAYDDKTNNAPKEKSRLEILAEQRDYKRRRQSYRAKNVHITKKSYTEILRDVIQNHTEALVLQHKNEDEISVNSISPKRENNVGSSLEITNSRSRHRSRSRSKDGSKRSSDHARKRKKSVSRERESSRKRHKDHKTKHKHKSAKKSHKRKSHHHTSSD